MNEFELSKNPYARTLAFKHQMFLLIRTLNSLKFKVLTYLISDLFFPNFLVVGNRM